ncbi:MAG: DUF1552 domain-containing protein [Lentisphaeraceae bacterium]|nr:DUF1552 domain-containing protein [Lentisphaeraceae bacterium]
MKKSYLIPRRTFLRGLGATCIGLPNLEIMANNQSKAKAPLRMAVLYKGCGVNPNSWDITGATEDNFKLSKTLSPLEKNKKDILVLRGIDSHPRANGGHPSLSIAFMSGLPKNKRFEQRYTFDQLIADKIGQSTPVKSLVMRSDHFLDPNDPVENFLSYDKTGKPLEVESSPEFVFNKLFKGFNNQKYRQQTTSVLDDIKESYLAVNRKASKQDKEVLTQYLQSIREVEKSIDKYKNKTPNKTQEARFRNLPPLSGSTNDMPGRTKAMLDLIALAFWTDMTRVSSLMMAHTESRTIYDFLGINDELHYLSHFARNKKAIPGYDKINQWYVAQLNYFISKLKSLKDGHQTLFDNSLIMFGSGMKHGDYHSVTDLPMILSGGAGGQLKLGRYVKYSKESNSNLLLKMMHLMGVKEEKYGLSTRPTKGLTEKANFKDYSADDGSWKILKKDSTTIEVKALLKSEFSEGNPNRYILKLSGNKEIEIKAPYMNIHKTRMDGATGSVVNLKGKFKLEGKNIVIHNVLSCKRL